MSIASEIARLQAAKVDIRAALVEKGVDVTGKNLVDVPDLIDSIIVGPTDDFILDDFVLLDNGVNNSGLAVNDGSFGELLYEDNGWVDGKPAPYYARKNFSGNSGAVRFSYNNLKSLFNHGDGTEWTFEFWYYANGIPSSKWFSSIRNDNGSSQIVEFSHRYEGQLGISVMGDVPAYPCQEGMWHHIAIVKQPTAFKTRALKFIDGIRVAGGDTATYSGTLADMSIIRFVNDATDVNTKIAQVALRDRAVWTSNFEPPRKLYKQK